MSLPKWKFQLQDPNLIMTITSAAGCKRYLLFNGFKLCSVYRLCYLTDPLNQGSPGWTKHGRECMLSSRSNQYHAWWSKTTELDWGFLSGAPWPVGVAGWVHAYNIDLPTRTQCRFAVPRKLVISLCATRSSDISQRKGRRCKHTNLTSRATSTSSGRKRGGRRTHRS